MVEVQAQILFSYATAWHVHPLAMQILSRAFRGQGLSEAQLQFLRHQPVPGHLAGIVGFISTTQDELVCLSSQI